MKHVVVVAGDYRQFREWCHRHRVSPQQRGLHFIDNPEKLRGLEGPLRNRRSFADLHLIGTWRERPDVQYVVEMIRSRGFEMPALN